MQKIFAASVLVFAVLISVLSCLCWVQLGSESCHVSQETAECCCGDQPEVTQADRDIPAAVLTNQVQLSPPGLISDIALDTRPSASVPLQMQSDIAASRASPLLYLINTSFQI